MAKISLDTKDTYVFDYKGTRIEVHNDELKATIELVVNGEVKATSKGIKAITGLGALETTLTTGEKVKATLKKMNIGDTACTVEVNGNALELVDQTHDKKDIVNK